MKQREHGNHETVRCVHVFLSLAWIDNLKFEWLNLSTIFCAIKYIYIVQIVRGRQYMMNAFRLSLLHPAVTLMCVFLFALSIYMNVLQHRIAVTTDQL